MNAQQQQDHARATLESLLGSIVEMGISVEQARPALLRTLRQEYSDMRMHYNGLGTWGAMADHPNIDRLLENMGNHCRMIRLLEQDVT